MGDAKAHGRLIADHHAGCHTCCVLYAYARARADHALLRAWRRQLVEHLRNEQALRESDPGAA